MYQVIIIGGGLAGLVSAILLKRSGLSVAVVEKNAFPHHKVCGEYISNEVKPFLLKNNLLPNDEELPQIENFMLSSLSGKSTVMPLDLGGFGLSRYKLDDFLYQKARESGVEFHLQRQAKKVLTQEDLYEVQLNDGSCLTCNLVIGAQGKRSTLDKALDREFIKKRSGFIAVKYHVKTDHPADTIALHNFEGGYCGISKIENHTYNLCYLGKREHLKYFGNIPEMEKNILFKNPHLRSIFVNSDFLFSEPLVINEFSFEKKKAVEGGVLMAGDAAGLITPLCGNGMALAIHSAKVLSEIIITHHKNRSLEKEKIFGAYTKTWNDLFAFRLWTGRMVQHLFGGKYSSEIAVGLMKNSKLIARGIIKNTHGHPF